MAAMALWAMAMAGCGGAAAPPVVDDPTPSWTGQSAPDAGAAAEPRCAPANGPIVAFKRLETIEIPGGWRASEVANAIVQAAASTGTAIANRDFAANTVTTESFAGQTLMSSCGVHECRAYKFQFAAMEHEVYAHADCVAFPCTGAVAGAPEWSGPPRECGDYITQGDSKLLSGFVSLAFDMLRAEQLKRQVDQLDRH